MAQLVDKLVLKTTLTKDIFRDVDKSSIYDCIGARLVRKALTEASIPFYTGNNKILKARAPIWARDDGYAYQVTDSLEEVSFVVSARDSKGKRIDLMEELPPISKPKVITLTFTI